VIEARIRGELAADPVHRATREGNPYVTAALRVPAGAESMLVTVAVFDAAGSEQVATLRKGMWIDAIGTLEVVAWTGRDGERRCGWRLSARDVSTVHRTRFQRDVAAVRASDAQRMPRRPRTQPPPGDARWLDA
jgi:single-stranded DNA-binding protein